MSGIMSFPLSAHPLREKAVVNKQKEMLPRKSFNILLTELALLQSNAEMKLFKSAIESFSVQEDVFSLNPSGVSTMVKSDSYVIDNFFNIPKKEREREKSVFKNSSSLPSLSKCTKKIKPKPKTILSLEEKKQAFLKEKVLKELLEVVSYLKKSSEIKSMQLDPIFDRTEIETAKTNINRTLNGNQRKNLCSNQIDFLIENIKVVAASPNRNDILYLSNKIGRKNIESLRKKDPIFDMFWNKILRIIAVTLLVDIAKLAGSSDCIPEKVSTK